MIKVGFLCSTNTQVQTFLPIAHALQKQGDINSFISLDNLYQLDAEKELNKHQQSFVPLGTTRLGCRFTQLSLLQMYRELWRLRIPINDMLQELDLLIVGNDKGLVEKQFIYQSCQQNLPTLLIQDGLLWRYEVRSLNWKQLATSASRKDLAKELLGAILRQIGLPHLAPSYMGQGGCDALAVMGEGTKTLLAERSILSQKIIVTGQPRYDKWLAVDRQEIQLAIRKKYTLPMDCFIVSIFTSAFELNMGRIDLQTRQERFVQELIALLQKHGQRMIICLKHHPRESQSGYAEAQREPYVHMLEGSDSLEVLQISDMVITVPSTIIGEALMLDKPLLIMRIDQELKGSTSYQLGSDDELLQEYDDVKSLFDAIDIDRKSSVNKPKEQFKASDIFVLHQLATPRIMDIIRELTSDQYTTSN